MSDMHMTREIPKKRSPYVTCDQWDSHGNNHWPMSTKTLVEMLYKMGKNRGTSWLFPCRRPANKTGGRKTLQMNKRTRDPAQLIDCIKKRINPCALEGLWLEIKNLISSIAFLPRQLK
ncbi:hypothetical protein XENORESO_003462 [Xenotaenia resolanae]|uniref:Uncharacterized protein n=1 Tax=Xenotaenia resolanae TaxID=208358 RepID=A0ABV0VZ95_9TELE